MTISVLILGNSHVAALRHGWAQIDEDFGGWDVQFFAANSNLFNKMTLDSNKVFGAHGTTLFSPRQQALLARLVGENNVGRLERRLRLPGRSEVGYTAHELKFLDQVFRRRLVDLKRFDHVILAGRNTNEVDFLRQFESFSIDGLREDPARLCLSQSAFDAFCTEIGRKRLPEPAWHNWDGPRIYMLPPPVPRADCPEDDSRYDVWARYGADPLTRLDFLKAYRARVAALYQDHGITLLSPPDNVYDDSGLTRVEFGDEATRLHPRAGTFEDSDFHHMSPEYGKIVLRHILKTLGSAEG